MKSAYEEKSVLLTNRSSMGLLFSGSKSKPGIIQKEKVRPEKYRTDFF